MNDIFDRWLLANAKGEKIVDFDTFISMDVSAQGKTISAPTEMGGFAVYNKVLQPTMITVSLGVYGEPDNLQNIINRLIDLRRTATTFSLISPEQEFKNLTLESFNYSRRREDGVNALYTDLTLVQVEPLDPDKSNKSRGIKYTDQQKTTKNPFAADIVKGAVDIPGTLSDGIDGIKTGALNGLKSAVGALQKVQSVYTKAQQLKTAVVGLKSLPNQVVNTILGGKNVSIHTFQRGGMLFSDISIDGVLKQAGAACAENVNLIGNSLKDLSGALSFVDTSGSSGDPDFRELGERFKLAFVPSADSIKGMVEDKLNGLVKDKLGGLFK